MVESHQSSMLRERSVSPISIARAASGLSMATHALNPARPASTLSDLGVDVLVCSAISSPLEAALYGLGVEVISDICGSPEEIIQALAAGDAELSALSLSRKPMQSEEFDDEATSPRWRGGPGPRAEESPQSSVSGGTTMVSPALRHVFGPVPSRRLGRSLGIDPVPLKTCNFSCVYCQLGRTRRLMARRTAFFSVTDIVAEVATALAHHKPGDIDWITFVGSGETTLSSRLGSLIYVRQGALRPAGGGDHQRFAAPPAQGAGRARGCGRRASQSRCRDRRSVSQNQPSASRSVLCRPRRWARRIP